MKPIAMTIIACMTALLIELVIDWRWEGESKLDRAERVYEFLLSHPELIPKGNAPKPGALVPGETA